MEHKRLDLCSGAIGVSGDHRPLLLDPSHPTGGDPLFRLPAYFVLMASLLACDSTDSEGSSERTVSTLPNGATKITYGTLDSVATLTEDLRIGENDGQTPYIFGDVRSIEADSEGTIYVLDHQASEVRTFSASGEYLATIVGRGEGPGEVTGANGMV